MSLIQFFSLVCWHGFGACDDVNWGSKKSAIRRRISEDGDGETRVWFVWGDGAIRFEVRCTPACMRNLGQCVMSGWEWKAHSIDSDCTRRSWRRAKNDKFTLSIHWLAILLVNVGLTVHWIFSGTPLLPLELFLPKQSNKYVLKYLITV